MSPYDVSVDNTHTPYTPLSRFFLKINGCSAYILEQYVNG